MLQSSLDKRPEMMQKLNLGHLLTERDHVKKTLIGIGAFALGALAFAVPAQATPGDNLWHANAGSTLDGTMTGGNTSIETTKAFPAQTVAAGTVLDLDYDLGEGATCIAGAPRVFATVGDTTVNSWDTHIADGVKAACTGEVTLPAGELTAIGVVWDNGQSGTITVTSLKLGSKSLSFKAYETETLETIKAPTATEPTCDVAGTVKMPTEQEQAGVKYTAKRNIENGVTVSATVTAEAKFGYEIKDDVKTTWTFPMAKLTGDQCKDDEQPTTPPAGPIKVVITEVPKIGTITCDKFDWSAQANGVTWKVDVTDVKDGVATVKFVATAKAGFVIDGQKEWTLTFKVPANCTASPAPSTSPTSGDQLPVTGPGGGTNTPLIAGLSGAALFFLGGALLLWARRRRDAVAFTA